MWLKLSGLEGVSNVGTEINRLVVGENIFFPRRHGCVFRFLIGRLKIGNDVEDTLRIFILLLVGPSRRCRGILLGGTRLLRLYFCDLKDRRRALFGFRRIWFFLRAAYSTASGKSQQQSTRKEQRGWPEAL